IAAMASAAARRLARAERSFVPSCRSMSLDLLRRHSHGLFSEPLEAVAAACACAEREQAGAEQEQRRGLGHARRRRLWGRRLLRRRRRVARADAAQAYERDAAEQRPPGQAGLRYLHRRNLAAVADRSGNVAEVNGLYVAAALRERRVG